MLKGFDSSNAQSATNFANRITKCGLPDWKQATTETYSNSTLIIVDKPGWFRYHSSSGRSGTISLNGVQVYHGSSGQDGMIPVDEGDKIEIFGYINVIQFIPFKLS